MKMTRIPKLSKIQKVRFFKKIASPNKNGCKLWVGAKAYTYGVFLLRVNGHQKRFLPHRIAYFLRHGQIQEELLVCHHCDTPLCCNDEHLFTGTNKDNFNDSVRKNRHSWNRKMSLAKAMEIRKDYSISKLTIKELMDKYDAGQVVISNIVHKKTYMGKRLYIFENQRHRAFLSHISRKRNTQREIKLAFQQARKEKIKLTQKNIAKLSGLSIRTVRRYWKK